MSANTTWTAIADYRDDTVRGGYRREYLAKRVTRDEADAAVYAAAESHAAATGHALRAPMTFPGKTHISCPSCVTFHATGLA